MRFAPNKLRGARDIPETKECAQVPRRSQRSASRNPHEKSVFRKELRVMVSSLRYVTKPLIPFIEL